METHDAFTNRVNHEFGFTSNSCHRTSQSASRMGRENICVTKIDSDGTKWSVLEGRSDVAGEAFTYAAFVPAGFHDFHSHATDARVAVVQGVLKVGFGETLDLEHLKSYAVGSFLFVPANVRHTMAADEDTIIIGTAVGPWHTHHQADQHH